MAERLSRSWPMLAAAAFGLVVFLLIGGHRILAPTHTTWIKAGSDWGYHWVGWLYYRNAEWGLPLGDTPNLFHPVGTTVGFMDGIPWLSLVMKVVSPILPDEWQHIGLWLALCFALQGWFGARLVATFTTSRPAIALGGALLALSPVLMHRVHHEALCAHFLILWALALYFRRDDTPPGVGHVVLPLVTIGVHPYLAAMVLAIVLASLGADVWSARIPWRAAAWRAGAAVGGMLVLALAFGYIGSGLGSMEAKGFGRFNSELFTLVNPQGDSRVLPDVRIRPGQDEGYGYLGLGGIALALSAIGVAIHARVRREPRAPWRRIVPLLVVVGLCTLFALAGKLTARGDEVADLGFLYEPLGMLRGTFRASGRFIWILTYVITVAAIATWIGRQPRLAPWVLGAALLVQLADLEDLRTDHFGAHEKKPKHARDWALARGDYDHMVVYPPRCGDPNGPCCPGFSTLPKPGDMYLAALAARLDLTYNGFGAARVAHAAFEPSCRDLRDRVARGDLAPRTIYVVAKKQESVFRARNPDAPCRRLDKELVCVAPAATGPFRDALLGAPPE